ncbi:SIP domain-containing protein [Nocardia sp. NPDC001965]
MISIPAARIDSTATGLIVSAGTVSAERTSTCNTSTRRIGASATEAVCGAQLPGRNIYASFAGEQQLAAGIRRYLVRDRGFGKSAVPFTGYWRSRRAACG